MSTPLVHETFTGFGHSWMDGHRFFFQAPHLNLALHIGTIWELGRYLERGRQRKLVFLPSQFQHENRCGYIWVSYVLDSHLSKYII